MSEWNCLYKDKIPLGEIRFEQHSCGLTLYWLKNADKRKYLSFAVPTPVPNSKGGPHILEHLLLRESLVYDKIIPYVEMNKAGFNILIDAKTTRGNTFFNVGTTITLDFYHMLDIYWNCLFYPRLSFENFSQEGVEYKTLGTRGVVYNEMKSIYQITQKWLTSRLWRETLTPPFCYDSGGDPDEMLNLDFQELLSIYTKYYTPGNTHLFCYGDLDIDVLKCNLSKKISSYTPSYINKKNISFSKDKFRTECSFTDEKHTGIFLSLGKNYCPKDYFKFTVFSKHIAHQQMQILSKHNLKIQSLIKNQNFIDQGVSTILSGHINKDYINSIIRELFSRLKTTNNSYSFQEEVKKLHSHWSTPVEDFPVRFFMESFNYWKEKNFSLDRFYCDELLQDDFMASFNKILEDVKYDVVDFTPTSPKVPNTKKIYKNNIPNNIPNNITKEEFPYLSLSEISPKLYNIINETKQGLWIKSEISEKDRLRIIYELDRISQHPVYIEEAFKSVYNDSIKISSNAGIYYLEIEGDKNNITFNNYYSDINEKIHVNNETKEKLFLEIQKKLIECSHQSLIDYGKGLLYHYSLENNLIDAIVKGSNDHFMYPNIHINKPAVAIFESSTQYTDAPLDIKSKKFSPPPKRITESVEKEINLRKILRGSHLGIDLGNLTLRQLAITDLLVSNWSSSDLIKNTRIKSGVYSVGIKIDYIHRYLSFTSSKDPCPEKTLEIFEKILLEQRPLDKAAFHCAKLLSINTFDWPRFIDHRLERFAGLWIGGWKLPDINNYKKLLFELELVEVNSFQNHSIWNDQKIKVICYD